jgi:hypothetical protein
MSRLALLAVVALVLPVAGLVVARARTAGDVAPDSVAPPPSDRVVVVELFTSQGCSSCPPADRLLTRLAEDAGYAGRVVPLSFHVDYWNHIGWTDPFSSPRWSQRQRRYAGRLAKGRVYTPQTVVDGRAVAVGSDERLIREQIAVAFERARDARIDLRVGAATAGVLPVRASVQLTGDVPGSADLELWVALAERGLVTPVRAGENAAATLRNDHVVRHLERLATLPRRSGSTGTGDIAFAIAAGWRPESLEVVAFLQDPASLAIHGAAVARLAAGR